MIIYNICHGDDDDKIRVLWKQSRGVVDIHKENLYTFTQRDHLLTDFK